MKATLTGTYAGSGGKQHITINGDLSVEGLSGIPSALLDKVCELEGKVAALQETVSRLQKQSMHSSVGELAKALETIKEESVAPVVAVEEPAPVVLEEAPVAKSTSKKK